ncbi:CueP family metal-binding protein [Jeotgalibacillus haloalkalitolerans]|uniref:CueP family metal-binding protein n=1 Tax=Jeotgalibacillus haloalkalitolerans TaxID=3104292 RepID=A0ABU5KJR4_9BACL|nr:CueP family metal-binding protein [Jeotgalibacillus sp. HH7-29]MDZ5711407.1 CueP family metal-binding protein [Jeotgalibacillus sp. HH7-29]
MKLKSIILLLLSSIILVACNSESEEQSQNQNESIDIQSMIQDFSTREAQAEQASINGKELMVTEEDGTEAVYDISTEDFFVSIAPYVNETHPCTYHSLTGCQGEMVEETFHVYIEDSEGNIIADENMTTFENGFIDLWLPRDDTYQVKIEHEGKTVESEISTFEEDPTCITTMQLT